ncbi:uncharacterized protein LOC124117597 [Haliotis rufescens]|uniref:uncharacterized protein LOC124117597 n=1 Tax=Haliotis rufescens TaxID=6454 RepID=UPI001EAFBFA1|nr:uncharacterized protein LOC124117597 [Haliotis rufescens]
MSQEERKGNVEMLEELRIRSLMASYMMFERATKYGNYAFWTLIGASIVMGVAAANLCQYLPVGDNKNWVLFSKTVIGLVSGFATTFETGRIFLLEYLDKKEKLYNETAAGWQKLELDIRLFLNYIDKAKVKDIRKFTKECIQQRDDVCSKSKPEGDTYDNYHDDPEILIEKYLKKQSVIAHIGQRLKEDENVKCKQNKNKPNQKKKWAVCIVLVVLLVSIVMFCLWSCIRLSMNDVHHYWLEVHSPHTSGHNVTQHVCTRLVTVWNA